MAQVGCHCRSKHNQLFNDGFIYVQCEGLRLRVLSQLRSVKWLNGSAVSEDEMTAALRIAAKISRVSRITTTTPTFDFGLTVHIFQSYSSLGFFPKCPFRRIPIALKQ